MEMTNDIIENFLITKKTRGRPRKRRIYVDMFEFNAMLRGHEVQKRGYILKLDLEAIRRKYHG